ncbi:MAG: IPT/TIG domain-containing protein [bacterium]
MKNNQKGFVVTLIIILLVLIVGGGIFYLSSKSAKVSAPSTLTPPSVSGLSPASGQIGTIVTVSGSGFDGGSRVSFEASGGNVGNWHLKPQAVSSQSLTFTVPTGVLVGSYIVIVANTAGDLSTNDNSHAFFTVTGSSTSDTQTIIKGPNTAKIDDFSIANDIKQLTMMAEQFSLDHNMTYVGFCTDTGKGVDLIWNDLTSRNVGGLRGILCKTTPSAYIISSSLNSGAYACIDSVTGAVSVKTNLIAFPTGMDCKGSTMKASTTPTSTPKAPSGSSDPSSSSASSILFNAKVVGGVLSKSDRDAIITGTMNMVSALNSGDPTLIRKYAKIITPPDQLDTLNKMTDQQLLKIMNVMGKNAAEDISPASLSSADATWSIIDSNNVEIKIQLAPLGSVNGSETIQATKVNGVWY